LNRPWGRVGLWAVVGSHALTDFYFGAVAATLPYFVTQANYSYTDIAGLALALTAVASVAQPGFGYLADRFRLRWAIPACIGATAVSMSLASSMVDAYAVVWVMIAIAGIASAGYHPPATIAIRELAPDSNAAMSVFAAAGNVGVALGPIAVVVIVGGSGLAASPLLLIPAAVGLVGYGLAARVDPALRQRTDDVPPPAHLVEIPGVEATMLPPAGEPAGHAIGEERGLFTRLVLTMTVWSLAYTATIAFIGLFVIEQFGLSEEAASTPLIVFPASGAVGTLLGGLLADRVGRLATIRVGYVVAASAAILIATAQSPWMAIAATGLLGAGLCLPFAPQLTLAHSYLPRHVGTASGVALGLTSAVAGVVTAILGHVGESHGLRAVFAILAGTLVAGLCGALFLRDPGRLPSVDASADAVLRHRPDVESTELDRAR
jgi:FSR family fosmidomycin resistance protein-like MFS transporter